MGRDEIRIDNSNIAQGLENDWEPQRVDISMTMPDKGIARRPSIMRAGVITSIASRHGTTLLLVSR